MRNIKHKNLESGAALVEFVIVLPFLLFLLMGIIEFGLLFYNQQVLTNASREGARAGISHLNESEIKAVVVNYCQDRSITFDTMPDVIPDDVDVSGVPGSYPDDLTVTVTYDYTFLVPGLLGFGPSMELTAETVMSMERKL